VHIIVHIIGSFLRFKYSFVLMYYFNADLLMIW